MISIDACITPADLLSLVGPFWQCSAGCIRRLSASWRERDGAPVFTVAGRYTARGWTEWTQGLQFGSPLLQFDATQDEEFLDMGLQGTLRRMPVHVSHVGVHDHGFNNVSTYGALWRLACSGRLSLSADLRSTCELALQVSGAIQASRWTQTNDGGGYIYSFNGPHSLFCDTIRSLRSLALAHQLGHLLMGENDLRISLLDRLIQHARTTARYNVYYGEGRDHYDIRGRVAHESLFNTNDGRFRCPSTQQGYSPFSTWTRGLAWIMLGFSEQLEFLDTRDESELQPFGGREALEADFLRAALAASDYYIESTPTDGVPYWDTGAPGLALLADHRDRPADPCNDLEPVDSSAAAIACQGLIRLGRWLIARGRSDPGSRYLRAGLTTLRTLMQPPYLNTELHHEGLLLHAVYHRPNGWDHIPPGSRIPRGESCLWGDYHLREAVLLLQRLAHGAPDYRFFGDAAQPA